MKNAGIIFLALLLINTAVFSQPLIKGRVINATSGEPLAGCTVFINSTSIGTVSDKDGHFELYSVPAGRHELIVSSIGYETNAYAFSSDKLPLQLRIEMTVKVKELENVTVEPYVEEGWDKWGKLFTENFIGSTPNSKQCRIKNTKAIHFRFYKKSNRLTAYSDEPLIIENKGLGYTIRYQLEEFEVKFRENSSVFAGYPFFEDVDKGGIGVKRRWEKAREKAYYGSIMHFMRSLYTDSLLQNGYEVRRMVRILNEEQQRVLAIYRAAMDSQNKAARAKGILNIEPPKLDSMDYYQQVMRQKSFKEIYGRDLMTADSITIKADKEKVLYFRDYLFVTYKGASEDKEYLIYNHENRSPSFQQSYIWLINMEPVIIDVNGSYYPPQALFSMAYWGWSEKVGNMLPADYREAVGY